MIKRKTLIILTPGFPESEADTTCVPSRQLFVKALKRNFPNLNVIVVAFQYPFIRSNYRFYGVNVISLNGKNKGKLYRGMVWLKAWRTLVKINNENNVIGILCFWLGECALVGNYFARLYKLKQLTWILGQDAKKHNPYFNLIKPKADSLIALSDFVAQEFYRTYSIRPKHIVPVGIDTSLFSDFTSERDIDIMGVGSLIPLKRYALFVDIIEAIVQHRPAIKAIICGQGPEKDELLNLIETKGLKQNMTLLGEVPHTEVLQLMQRSRIFLHTSEYEGYGTVTSEALYSGAYVINFCKPMQVTFHHEYFVRSKEEAVDKAASILEDENREHSRVLTYSVDEVAKRIMDLFD